jgi:hypothetical protein
VRPARRHELDGHGAVRLFAAPRPHARFEEALRVEGFDNAIDVPLQLEEVELVALLDLDFLARRRRDRLVDAAERDLLISGLGRRAEGGLLSPPPNVTWWRMPMLAVPLSRDSARISMLRRGK